MHSRPVPRYGLDGPIRHSIYSLQAPFPGAQFHTSREKQVTAFEKGSAESLFDSAGFDCKGKGSRVMRFAHNSSLPVLLPILEAKTDSW